MTTHLYSTSGAVRLCSVTSDSPQAFQRFGPHYTACRAGVLHGMPTVGLPTQRVGVNLKKSWFQQPCGCPFRYLHVGNERLRLLQIMQRKYRNDAALEHEKATARP